jgi:hypothetical protein
MVAGPEEHASITALTRGDNEHWEAQATRPTESRHPHQDRWSNSRLKELLQWPCHIAVHICQSIPEATKVVSREDSKSSTGAESANLLNKTY